jgi:lysyl-tRNA synthetase class 1
LALFMFREPKAAKKLYFDVIPRNVDEYYQFLDAYERQTVEQKLGNPVWHLHGGEPPKKHMPASFSMLMNLVSASNAEDRDVLWGFIKRVAPGVTPENSPELDRLVGYAIRYFHDFVKPTKVFRAPDAAERGALQALDLALAKLAPGADADEIQSVVFDVGRAHFPDPAKKGPDGGPGVSLGYFASLYQILLGQEKGPRFGSFVALYGLAETRALIGAALDGTLAAG